MTQFATLRFTTAGPVATVTLDRPECLNAYDRQMRDDLFEVLDAVHDDPSLRVLVLRGRGRAFSAGGDLREFGSAPSPTVARAVRFRRDVWGRLLELRAATLASVHGLAVGGGMEMAMLCDLVVASAGARFALPECGLGMIPGVAGTQTLARRAHTGVALELVLHGRFVGAAEARRLGIVTQVVPERDLAAATGRLARLLAALDPAVVAAVRRCVRAAHDGTLADGIALERRLALGLEAPR
ncbi:MAG TPA: enoyl-CoA hydratase/isomerase family protein [Candidatus Limnocylindria bacterium]|nr:enoyl-CoA hydratase/isomerase family protein [Candidatus Limnocylindria bacterium]